MPIAYNNNNLWVNDVLAAVRGPACDPFRAMTRAGSPPAGRALRVQRGAMPAQVRQ